MAFSGQSILDQDHRKQVYSYSAALSQYFSRFLYIHEGLIRSKFLCQNTSTQVCFSVILCWQNQFISARFLSVIRGWNCFNLQEFLVAHRAESYIMRCKHWLHLIPFCFFPFSNAYTILEIGTIHPSPVLLLREKVSMSQVWGYGGIWEQGKEKDADSKLFHINIQFGLLEMANLQSLSELPTWKSQMSDFPQQHLWAASQPVIIIR